MKKFFFVVLLLLIAVSASRAQFFCEDFEYPTGDTINQHQWVKFSGLGVNPVLIEEPGLELSCYAVTFGNAAKLKETGEDSYKFLPQITDSGTVYVSFLVKFLVGQTGDCFFHLGDSVVNNSNKIARVYAKFANGKIAVGLAKNNEDPIYTPGDYIFGETYLIVLKYEFVAGNDNDLVSLFVFGEENCPSCQEPSMPTIGPFGSGENDLPNIGKIVLQQGAGSKSATLLIDAICIDNVFCNGALPVELSSFTSTVNESNVTLNWTTTSETNNSEFQIERKATGNWETIGYVQGHGTSTIFHTYQFTDKNVQSGKYQYRLMQIDFNGNYEYHNLQNEVVIGTPEKFTLKQNYPNPFNPITRIEYSLPEDGMVNLVIYDINGKEVCSLVNESQPAGYYSVDFDGSDLSSGMYFYNLTAGKYKETKKMILMK